MRMWVLYRAAPGGNRKNRPDWFSKWLCLASLVRAAEAAPSDVAVTVTFICDGPLLPPVHDLMTGRGTVEVLAGLGNSGSFLHTLKRAAAADVADRDVVYLVEDDWLHLPGALAPLARAVLDGPGGAYATPYDHPDRYTRADDIRVPGRPVEFVGGHHWQRVESATMTFAALAGTLRADHRFHWASARFTSYPHDRALWRSVQGLGVRRPLRWRRGRRVLLGAVPALATHVEREVLAPGVDWTAEAEATARWMRERDLPTEVPW